MMVMIALFYCAGLTIQFHDSIVVIFVVVVLIISFHDRDDSFFHDFEKFYSSNLPAAGKLGFAGPMFTTLCAPGRVGHFCNYKLA